MTSDSMSRIPSLMSGSYAKAIGELLRKHHGSVQFPRRRALVLVEIGRAGELQFEPHDPLPEAHEIGQIRRRNRLGAR